MRIETKYEMGQGVWRVACGNFNRIVRCLTCNNTGAVRIVEEDFVCPKCKGLAKHPQYAGERWYIDEHLTIGRIDVYVNERNDGMTKVQYLADGWGGSVLDEANLFPSREEAEAECLRRNVGLLTDEV